MRDYSIASVLSRLDSALPHHAAISSGVRLWEVYLKGAFIVRGTTKLLLKLTLVGLGHIGILFIVYGIQIRFFLLANAWEGNAFTIFLLCSPAIPFVLNYFFISRSGLMSENLRRTKAAVISIAPTIVSLYVGMFLCLNTFGE